MITAQLEFDCMLCKNKKDFYVMPLDQKTKSNDFIHSPTNYRLSCKKCGQDYILKFSIKLLKRKK